MSAVGRTDTVDLTPHLDLLAYAVTQAERRWEGIW